MRPTPAHRLGTLLGLLAALALPAGAADAPAGDNADNVDDDPAATAPAALRALLPPGQELLAWRQADHNRDGRPDWVYILQNTGSHPYDDDRGDAPRSLLVALGRADGPPRVVARNDHLVRCQNCGGSWPEPFEALQAATGRFSLSHYGGSRWRWSDAWAFVWSPAHGDWLLDRVSDGADTPADGHRVRTYRRGQHFGSHRLRDVDSETFLARGLWPRVPKPPARRAPERD
jgi:hypothetical protein